MPKQGSTYKNLPFIGDTFLFKETDAPRNKPVRENKSHARVFCTDNPVDMKDLAAVYTKARNGMVYIEDIDKKCVEKDNTCIWFTYMVWTDKYYKNPKSEQE